MWKWTKHCIYVAMAMQIIGFCACCHIYTHVTWKTSFAITKIFLALIFITKKKSHFFQLKPIANKISYTTSITKCTAHFPTKIQHRSTHFASTPLCTAGQRLWHMPAACNADKHLKEWRCFGLPPHTHTLTRTHAQNGANRIVQSV